MMSMARTRMSTAQSLDIDADHLVAEIEPKMALSRHCRLLKSADFLAGNADIKAASDTTPRWLILPMYARVMKPFLGGAECPSGLLPRCRFSL